MTLWAKVSCDLPNDPKIIEVGPLGELMYLRCLLQSRVSLTDGVVDARVLERWCAGVARNLRPIAEKLVAVGLWEPHPCGYRFPERVWAAWNPSASDVQAKRKADAERKRQWRATRASQRDNPSRDADATQTRRPRDRQPETETETETEQETTTSPPHSRLYAPGGGVGGGSTLTAACRLLAEQDMAQRHDVRNPTAWLRAATASYERDLADEAARHLAACPTATPEQLARALTGHPPAPTRSPTRGPLDHARQLGASMALAGEHESSFDDAVAGMSDEQREVAWVAYAHGLSLARKSLRAVTEEGVRSDSADGGHERLYGQESFSQRQEA